LGCQSLSHHKMQAFPKTDLTVKLKHSNLSLKYRA
jgi:hypothetical protein